MAEGIEVLLGWSSQDFALAADRLGIRLPVIEAEWDEAGEIGYDDWLFATERWDRDKKRMVGRSGEGPSAERLREPLRLAHRKALTDLGYKFLRNREPEDGSGPEYETPWGIREFRVWNPGMHYDPSEQGEKRSQAVFGIQLSSRYRPIFLDAERAHGTLNSFALDWDFNDKVRKARVALAEFFPNRGLDPAWAQAQVFIKFTSY